MLFEWQGILRMISGFSFDRVFFSVTVLWLLIKPMVKKACGAEPQIESLKS